MKQVLGWMGVEKSRDSDVSEEELRMIVMGAKISGEIQTEEQTMIESVLDLQVSATQTRCDRHLQRQISKIVCTESHYI